MNDTHHNEDFEQHTNQEEPTSGTNSGEDAQKEMSKDPSLEKAPIKPFVLVGVLALITVVLALVYIWGASLTGTQTEGVPERYPPILPSEGQRLEETEPVSSSDEIDAIERDLRSTDIDGLDAELNSIESELDTFLAE